MLFVIDTALTGLGYPAYKHWRIHASEEGLHVHRPFGGLLLLFECPLACETASVAILGVTGG